jgi:K+-sensing histidine kinase KdpD
VKADARALLRWAAWLAATALLTAAMAYVRGGLERVHVALAYLLLVLAASARETRALALTVAVAGFVCFNYFFLPPYGTLGVADGRDWLVLFTFLAVAAVAAQLLHRARHHAAQVEQLSAEAARVEALRESERLKDALLASVSHDLRTPLTTIKALAHELSEGGDERAVIIEEEADRLNRFVADLLDLSRLDAGELRVSTELVAAEDLLGAALQRVSGALGEREVAVRIQPEEPLLLGWMDFVQALRVVVNLLENAHKYAPPGTPVELTASREDDRLLLRVADRGPGVPELERERIFQPFYRHPQGEADVGGAGLGLSISRRLAVAQGGRLLYEPRPGGGSSFLFELPAGELPTG